MKTVVSQQIHALASGSEQCWTQFLNAHENSFLRLAWRKCRDWDKARDAVQDALLKAIERLHDGFFDETGVEHFKNYIFTLIKRRAYVSPGSRRVASAEEFDFDQVAKADPGFSRMEFDDELLQVQEAMNELLSWRERAVLDASFSLGDPMSNREIAEHHGIPYGTVCCDKKRALEKLRQRLQRVA